MTTNMAPLKSFHFIRQDHQYSTLFCITAVKPRNVALNTPAYVIPLTRKKFASGGKQIGEIKKGDTGRSIWSRTQFQPQNIYDLNAKQNITTKLFGKQLWKHADKVSTINASDITATPNDIDGFVNRLATKWIKDRNTTRSQMKAEMKSTLSQFKRHFEHFKNSDTNLKEHAIKQLLPLTQMELDACNSERPEQLRQELEEARKEYKNHAVLLNKIVTIYDATYNDAEQLQNELGPIIPLGVWHLFQQNKVPRASACFYNYTQQRI